MLLGMSKDSHSIPSTIKMIGEETITETILARLASGKTMHIRIYGAGEMA